MSVQSSTVLLPILSHWNVSKESDCFSFGGSGEINSIHIWVFNEKDNQRLEVHARTNDLQTYFKIIDVAQNHFTNKSEYYFDSTYDHFPKNQDGFCTVEAVKDRQSKLNNGLFEITHLTSSLAYYSRYETKEELTKHLSTALSILQKADSNVEEITSHLEAFLKV